MTDKIRWGVLGGTSWIARDAIMPGIRKSRNGVLAATASRDPDEARRRYGEEAGVRIMGYDELIADPAIDAIYIPLPNSMHAEWALKAAKAKKPVLCEKPLGLDAAEVATMFAAFEQAGVPLMESFMYRFHPQHARVREIIDSGVIGEVLEVRSHLSNNMMSPPDPKNVRMIPELGGGVLLDMGCYVVSSARMVMQAEPLSIRGWQKLDKRFGVDVADGAVLEFPGGRMAVVSCSFETTGLGHYSVIGRNGMIEVPRGLVLGLGNFVPEALIVTVDKNGKRSEELLPANDHYQLTVEAFADAVIHGKPVPLSPQDSLGNAKVLDAWIKSVREGRDVQI
ncbi:MAG: Gfo/Idh/MocA family oxidoreductase [Proteobacteria bacterium]|nr:Gfo/Idh/MocA family oxidoreductase [Pseudomonadota bacterium]